MHKLLKFSRFLRMSGEGAIEPERDAPGCSPDDELPSANVPLQNSSTRTSSSSPNNYPSKSLDRTADPYDFSPSLEDPHYVEGETQSDTGFWRNGSSISVKKRRHLSNASRAGRTQDNSTVMEVEDSSDSAASSNGNSKRVPSPISAEINKPNDSPLSDETTRSSSLQNDQNSSTSGSSPSNLACTVSQDRLSPVIVTNEASSSPSVEYNRPKSSPEQEVRPTSVSPNEVPKPTSGEVRRKRKWVDYLNDSEDEPNSKDAVDTSLSADPAEETPGDGGRLQFYLDGRFVLELRHNNDDGDLRRNCWIESTGKSYVEATKVWYPHQVDTEVNLPPPKRNGHKVDNLLHYLFARNPKRIKTEPPTSLNNNYTSPIETDGASNGFERANISNSAVGNVVQRLKTEKQDEPSKNGDKKGGMFVSIASLIGESVNRSRSSSPAGQGSWSESNSSGGRISRGEARSPEKNASSAFAVIESSQGDISRADVQPSFKNVSDSSRSTVKSSKLTLSIEDMIKKEPKSNTRDSQEQIKTERPAEVMSRENIRSLVVREIENCVNESIECLAVPWKVYLRVAEMFNVEVTTVSQWWAEYCSQRGNSLHQQTKQQNTKDFFTNKSESAKISKDTANKTVDTKPKNKSPPATPQPPIHSLGLPSQSPIPLQHNGNPLLSPFMPSWLTYNSHHLAAASNPLFNGAAGWYTGDSQQGLYNMMGLYQGRADAEYQKMATPSLPLWYPSGYHSDISPSLQYGLHSPVYFNNALMPHSALTPMEAAHKYQAAAAAYPGLYSAAGMNSHWLMSPLPGHQCDGKLCNCSAVIAAAQVKHAQMQRTPYSLGAEAMDLSSYLGYGGLHASALSLSPPSSQVSPEQVSSITEENKFSPAIERRTGIEPKRNSERSPEELERIRNKKEQERARLKTEQEKLKEQIEIEKAKERMDQERRRIEQEMVRMRKEQEEAARVRIEQEAVRVKMEQEADRVKTEKETAKVRMEQEAAIVRFHKESMEAERMRKERARFHQERVSEARDLSLNTDSTSGNGPASKEFLGVDLTVNASPSPNSGDDGEILKDLLQKKKELKNQRQLSYSNPPNAHSRGVSPHHPSPSSHPIPIAHSPSTTHRIPSSVHHAAPASSQASNPTNSSSSTRKSLRPKHYKFQELTIGSFGVKTSESVNTSSSKGGPNRFKVIFTQRKFVYEFELPHPPGADKDLPTRHVACIVVPFSSVEALQCSGVEVTLRVNSTPLMFRGERQSGVGCIPGYIMYNMSQAVDLTGGQLAATTLHKLTLVRPILVDQLKIYLLLYDSRFREILQASPDDASTNDLKAEQQSDEENNE